MPNKQLKKGNTNDTYNLISDPHLNTLFKRIREEESKYQEAVSQFPQESKYKTKVYTRDLNVKKEYFIDTLAKALAVYYKQVQPYLPRAITFTDLFKNISGEEFYDTGIIPQDMIMLRVPTFSAPNTFVKAHYIMIAFRDAVSQQSVEALSRQMNALARYDARNKAFGIDAITTVIVANRAISEENEDNNNNNEDNDNNQKKKPFLTGNARFTILLIGNNVADMLNRLVSILCSFYASKLAGIFAGDQTRYTSKQALKLYFLRKSFSLLSTIIKNGILSLPTNDLRFHNKTIEYITIRLLTILETFKNIFTTTAETVKDTYNTIAQQYTDSIIKKLEILVSKQIEKMFKDVKYFLTRKALTVMLRHEYVYDFIDKKCREAIIDAAPLHLMKKASESKLPHS